MLAYTRTEYPPRSKDHNKGRSRYINHSTTGTDESKQEVYTGLMSEYSRRRAKRAIQLLVASAKEKEAPYMKKKGTYKFKVNFITLTLPAPQGNVSDRALKTRCLDPWIKRMRRNFKLNNYVWRAERQQNGNLHFHFATDTWIRYDHIRDHWNACLQQFDFIDRFEQKHGHRNPNSTDVHAIWKVKNLTQYFIKYMTKADKKENRIEGKVWDCSERLKLKQNCEFFMEGEVQKIWELAKANPEVQGKDDALYSLLFFTPSQFKRFVTGRLAKEWESYLTRIRDGEPQQPSRFISKSAR